MKKLTIAITVAIIVISARIAHAVQFQAIEVSNKVITCDSNSWLLRWTVMSFPGACIVIPDHTLEITATPEVGGAMLTELHIVATHQGKYYKYNHETTTDGIFWKEASLSEVADPLAKPSFSRNGFIDHGGLPSLTRTIYFEQMPQGAEIFAGARSVSGAPFLDEDVKRIFTIQ